MRREVCVIGDWEGGRVPEVDRCVLDSSGERGGGHLGTKIGALGLRSGTNKRIIALRKSLGNLRLADCPLVGSQWSGTS